MKKLSWVLGLLISTSLHAEEALSEECLKSMQQLYKFYYHEIAPKNKSDLPSDRLAESETQELQNILGELKTHCSPELIAKMNQFLQEDNNVG